MIGERLEGKVAQVLNEREVVINRGRDHGVTEGMKFAILTENPIEVIDPDSGDSLGLIDREKIRVQAAEIHDNFSICTTYETRTIGGGALSALDVDVLFGPRRKVLQTLKSSEYPKPLSPEESYVKVGDRVRELGARLTADDTP